MALARTRAPVIPVHFHVITAGSSLVDGNIPYVATSLFLTSSKSSLDVWENRDTQVLDSIKVLNRDFAKTGLSFKLVNTTRTWNAPWFERAARKNVEQTAMKQNLRFDGAGVLNVYSVGYETTSI